jgi:phage shock protein A
MALLERVATLIRANLNELIDKAENPETMIKQVILDMENQLLQVKTQVAVAIADQHVLEKKLRDNEESERNWRRRAEKAVDQNDDPLARSALERSMSYNQLAESFRQQVEDQKTQVENLKTALLKLQQKLDEARAKSDLLIAQHRRTRAMHRAGEAGRTIGGDSHAAAFDRMKDRVQQHESVVEATSELLDDDLEDRFSKMEKESEVDRLLEELKAKRRA